MTTRSRLVAAVALSAVLMTGCTGGGDGGSDATPEPTGTQGGAEEAGQADDAAGTDPGTASVADGVMAEQTVATPAGAGNGRGGDVTVALRSVEVAGGTMTVRWALTWSDDSAPADAGAAYDHLGITPVTTVTDREALKAYRPFCTDGAWHIEGGAVADVDLAQLRCSKSMLVSPPDNASFEFPNHGTVEAWAVLPAPEGRPATVDVAPAEGLPIFTDATVTYLDEE